MANESYAFIKNGVVVNLAMFDDPSEELLAHFKAEFDLDEIILSTEKSDIGGTYDGTNFWRKQPYPSWVKGTFDWEPPVPKPEDNKNYVWHEESLSWVEITLPTE